MCGFFGRQGSFDKDVDSFDGSFGRLLGSLFSCICGSFDGLLGSFDKDVGSFDRLWPLLIWGGYG